MPKTGDVYGVLSQGETGGLVVGGGHAGPQVVPKTSSQGREKDRSSWWTRSP